MLIPPKILRGVSRAVSTDESRLQLTGVFLERKGPHKASATATDGKMLMHAEWAEEDWREFPAGGANLEPAAGAKFLLPREAAAELVKLPPRKSPIKPILANLAMEEATLNGTALFVATDLATRSERTVGAVGIAEMPEDMTYPDYASALEPGPRPVRFRMNARYFARIIEAVAEAAELPAAEPYVDITIATEADRSVPCRPILVTAKHAQGIATVTGAVMPLLPLDPEPRTLEEVETSIRDLRRDLLELRRKRIGLRDARRAPGRQA